MASATARLAVSSLAPDIEPERSRTMDRLTGARVGASRGGRCGQPGQDEAGALAVGADEATVGP